MRTFFICVPFYLHVRITPPFYNSLCDVTWLDCTGEQRKVHYFYLIIIPWSRVLVKVIIAQLALVTAFYGS
jgi:hypothetical protein